MINTKRGSALTPIIAIITVLVIVVAVVVYNAPSDDEMTNEDAMMEDVMMEDSDRMDGDSMVEDEGHMMEDESMMEKDDSMMEEGGEMMEEGVMESGDMSFSGSIISGDASPLLEFNEADYQKARASDKLVVLYFYASWCPICKKEFEDTKQSFDELTTDKVVGFRVHFNDNDTTDEHKALAREFGVGYQHTKVFLKDGERILKSPEVWSKDRYLEEINKNI